MRCREERARLMELARSGGRAGLEMEAHLSACEECSRFLEEQRDLTAALARIAEENAAVVVPDGVRMGVWAELSPRRHWRPLAGAALAASLAVGVFVAHGPAQEPEAFVEIPFVAPLAPYERASVERMDVPVAALAAAGFEVHVPDMAGTVKADVLVGQDGRAHAIRLISEVNR